MQCVTCNKSFLFTSRLKALEYQKKKTTIIMEQKKVSKCSCSERDQFIPI
jgi:hypothetical protein